MRFAMFDVVWLFFTVAYVIYGILTNDEKTEVRKYFVRGVWSLIVGLLLTLSLLFLNNISGV